MFILFSSLNEKFYTGARNSFYASKNINSTILLEVKIFCNLKLVRQQKKNVIVVIYMKIFFIVLKTM